MSMKTLALVCVSLLAATLGNSSVNALEAQTTNAVPVPTTPVPPVAQSQTVGPASQTPPPGSIGISSTSAEIVRLSKTGVDAGVIKSFIESSPSAYYPTTDEIIYLHSQGVPPELITTLIKRGAVLRAQAVQASQAQGQGQVPMPATAAPTIITQPDQTANVIASVPPVTTVTQPVYIYDSPSYVYSGYPYYNYGFSVGVGFGWPYYYSSWRYPYYRGGYHYGYGYHGGYYHGAPYRPGFAGHYGGGFAGGHGYIGGHVGFGGRPGGFGGHSMGGGHHR